MKATILSATFSYRMTEMFDQSIKKGELVFETRLIKGIVPPESLRRRLETGVPQPIWNLRGLLKELNPKWVRTHVRASSKAAVGKNQTYAKPARLCHPFAKADTVT